MLNSCVIRDAWGTRAARDMPMATSIALHHWGVYVYVLHVLAEVGGTRGIMGFSRKAQGQQGDA